MGAFDQKNIFKILVATDIHLGYLEKDAERGKDSYNTFEEILEIASTKDVDFILLGGDLFHDNKPSRNSLLQCMELLRKYTFGDKPVPFDFISDPAENFPHMKNPLVNYQDPNMNVSIPVFSIHGNHDDPSGLGQHSPLEMLSASGLINYFGRVNDLNKVKISPLLMTKGEAKLSLYGLSALKDERLFRLFRENKVTMLRPIEDMEQWFNIFVLHQNHTKHSLTNYIPEEFLDSFLDLVIWGHEHECLIDPRESAGNAFNIIQPGSSIATSLCPGEAVSKHVAILQVNCNKQMKITKVPLKTVRPFVFEDLSLKDEDFSKLKKKKGGNEVEELVEKYVEGMLERAKKQLTGHQRQPSKPLIRLRVEYTQESQMFNMIRFGHKFVDSVANPEGILLFRKYRKGADLDENGVSGDVNQEAMDAVFNSDHISTKVEDIVEQYFSELENEEHRLQLLSVRGLAYAVNQFVEKEDRDAINVLFQHQVDKTRAYLNNLEDLTEDRIEEAIENFHAARLAQKEEEEADAISALNNPTRKEKLVRQNDDDYGADDDQLDDESPPKLTRGGRGSRRGRTSGRGTRKSASKPQLEMIVTENSASTKGRRRGQAGASTSTAASTSRASLTLNDYFVSSDRQNASSTRRKGARFDSDEEDF